MGSNGPARSVFAIVALSVANGCGESVAPARTATPETAPPPPSIDSSEQPGPRTGPNEEQRPVHSGGHDEHAAHEHSHEHGSHGYDMDFSDVERFAKHFDGPERDAWQKPQEVIGLLEVRAGNTVVDLGAGTGYFVRWLSIAVSPSGRVIAIDAAANMVSYIERRAQTEGWKNVEARVVPPDDPKLDPSSVDRILIVNTWHHISDRERYSAKLAASLRRGGAVFVVDFTLESDMGPPAEHRLAPERVARELEAGGLRSTVVRETLPKQYVVIGAKKYSAAAASVGAPRLQ